LIHGKPPTVKLFTAIISQWAFISLRTFCICTNYITVLFYHAYLTVVVLMAVVQNAKEQGIHLKNVFKDNDNISKSFSRIWADVINFYEQSKNTSSIENALNDGYNGQVHGCPCLSKDGEVSGT